MSDTRYNLVWCRAEQKLKSEHVIVAEKALGHPLPKGAEVHHVDGNGKNNRSDNLVICQDTSYHRQLHRRKQALDAVGDPWARKCTHCKEWDKAENLYISSNGYIVKHRRCAAKYTANRHKV